jgi:hypothetical protein
MPVKAHCRLAQLAFTEKLVLYRPKLGISIGHWHWMLKPLAGVRAGWSPWRWSWSSRWSCRMRPLTQGGAIDRRQWKSRAESRHMKRRDSEQQLHLTNTNQTGSRLTRGNGKLNHDLGMASKALTFHEYWRALDQTSKSPW